MLIEDLYTSYNECSKILYFGKNMRKAVDEAYKNNCSHMGMHVFNLSGVKFKDDSTVATSTYYISCDILKNVGLRFKVYRLDKDKDGKEKYIENPYDESGHCIVSFDDYYKAYNGRNINGYSVTNRTIILKEKDNDRVLVYNITIRFI